jgi:hypothetical protein
MTIENRRLRARAAGNRDRSKRARRVSYGVHADEQRDDEQRVLHRHDKWKMIARVLGPPTPGKKPTRLPMATLQAHKHECVGLKNAG